MQKKVESRKKKNSTGRKLPVNPSANTIGIASVDETSDEGIIPSKSPIEELQSLKNGKPKTPTRKTVAKKKSGSGASKLNQINVQFEKPKETPQEEPTEEQVEQPMDSPDTPPPKSIVKPTKRKAASRKKAPVTAESTKETVKTKSTAKPVIGSANTHTDERLIEIEARKEYIKNLKDETASYLQQLAEERRQRQQARLRTKK